MGGPLLLIFVLLLPSLVECGPPAPPSTPYNFINHTKCMSCPIPPTIKDCGTTRNPQCRPPFSMPYRGQNGVSTCARLRCPENYDMFVNTAASAREGDRVVDFSPKRVVLNPQTIICTRYGDEKDDAAYKFMIRDGQGFMRPVNDVQCRQNNFPRHSCVTDGFLKQECRNDVKCVPISYLSDYGGNKCTEPYKLMMRFSAGGAWEEMKKLSCDRELGWWRIHFPNKTWMHTRYGTIATCVSKAPTPPDLTVSYIVRGVIIVVVVVISLVVSFNAFMCRSVVVWEGSNWQRLWDQGHVDLSPYATVREMKQAEIVRGLRQSKWHVNYGKGLQMDLRQYDIMNNTIDKSNVVADMRPWTMLDDFDYYAQQEEAKESEA